MRASPSRCRKMPIEARGGRSRSLMTRAVKPPVSRSGVRRASTRSPMPGARCRPPGRPFSEAITTRGASPHSSSHSVGTPIGSPESSMPSTVKSVTEGRSPGRRRRFLRPSIRPSSASSRRIRFSAIFSPPESPKARAISRLPALPACSDTNSRIASRVGSSGPDLVLELRANLFDRRLGLGRGLLGGRLARGFLGTVFAGAFFLAACFSAPS